MQELSGMMVKKGVDCIMERARKTWKTHKNDAENGHWAEGPRVRREIRGK